MNITNTSIQAPRNGIGQRVSNAVTGSDVSEQSSELKIRDVIDRSAIAYASQIQKTFGTGSHQKLKARITDPKRHKAFSKAVSDFSIRRVQLEEGQGTAIQISGAAILGIEGSVLTLLGKDKNRFPSSNQDTPASALLYDGNTVLNLKRKTENGSEGAFYLPDGSQIDLQFHETQATVKRKVRHNSEISFETKVTAESEFKLHQAKVFVPYTGTLSYLTDDNKVSCTADRTLRPFEELLESIHPPGSPATARSTESDPTLLSAAIGVEMERDIEAFFPHSTKERRTGRIGLLEAVGKVREKERQEQLGLVGYWIEQAAKLIDGSRASDLELETTTGRQELTSKERAVYMDLASGSITHKEAAQKLGVSRERVNACLESYLVFGH